MYRSTLIIPAYNAEACLAQTLPGLATLGPEWEILVVDDGSPRSPAPLVEQLLPRAKCLRSERASGAAGARNYGALSASSEILVFLDADVIVEPETLQELAQKLSDDNTLSGVFGCYSEATPTDHTPISRFRNLLHRYVHHRCAGVVASFWTGLGAVRRDALLAVGGFSESLTSTCSIEDVEFGARLGRAGYQVLLDPKFEGVHLKRWTWPSMVRTDIFQRAVPWTQLIAKGRVDSKVMNGGLSFRVGPILLLATLALCVFSSHLAALTGLGYVLVHLPICSAMNRAGGWAVGLVTLPAMAVHHCCCWLGALIGLLSLHRLPPPPCPSALTREDS